eukprot:7739485-Ditylum_brightwellii.AAC.1
MRDKKENKKTSQKQDNSSSACWQTSLTCAPDRKTSVQKIKDSVGPQAVENKAVKKDAQIKATAGPQAAENKVTKEDAQMEASAGPQAVENKVMNKDVQDKAIEGPTLWKMKSKRMMHQLSLLRDHKDKLSLLCDTWWKKIAIKSPPPFRQSILSEDKEPC